LHGDLEQRNRAYILQKFREKKSKSILVATDVASRGLDVEDIDVIVQFRVRHVDSFVHRTGRTGRAGKEGINIVLCSK
jgi:superfamily II DNA/RNA helicase